MITHKLKGDIIVVKYISMVSKVHEVERKFFFEISFLGEEQPMRVTFDEKEITETERNKLIQKIEGRHNETNDQRVI